MERDFYIKELERNPLKGKKKGGDECYGEEGMGGFMLQNQAILGIQNPIKSYARAAEKKSLPPFFRQRTNNCCAWTALSNREHQRRKHE
jgi:hypothetical protein